MKDKEPATESLTPEEIKRILKWRKAPFTEPPVEPLYLTGVIRKPWRFPFFPRTYNSFYLGRTPIEAEGDLFRRLKGGEIKTLRIYTDVQGGIEHNRPSRTRLFLLGFALARSSKVNDPIE